MAHDTPEPPSIQACSNFVTLIPDEIPVVIIETTVRFSNLKILSQNENFSRQ